MAEFMKRASPVLAMAAVLLGLLSPLSAYPVFQTGYWNLVDSSFLAILVSGILAAGWIVSMGFQSRVGQIQFPPSALFLIVLAVVGVIAAMNAAFPFVALIGTYQSGYGPIWHLVAALLIVAARDLLRHDGTLKMIVIAAIGVAAILSATLAYSHMTSNTILIPSSDGYGLIGFFMLFIPRAKWRHKTVSRLCFWALYISAIALVLLSKNASLIALLSVGACLWLLLRNKSEVQARLQCIPTGVMTLLVLMLATAPLVFMMSNAADVGGQTLRMRSVIADIMIAGLQRSSGADLIVGHGWGHTQAAFYQYLHWGQMVLYEQEWDFLWRDMFHSHNFVIETLYSVGGIGLACFLAFLVSVYASTPVHQKIAALAFVAGYVLYSSVWYELSFHLPYMALALASISARPDVTGKTAVMRENAGSHWGVIIAAGAVILCLSIVAVTFAQFSSQITVLKPDRNSLENRSFSTAVFPRDPRGTDFVRSMLYRDVLRRFEQHVVLRDAEGLKVLGDILEDVIRRAPQTRSPELVLVGLDLFNNITFVPEWKWATAVISEKGGAWNDLALRSIDLAPYRSDVLIPYLTHLLATGQFEKLMVHVRRIELKNSNDPIGLYYFGAILSQSPDATTKQKGLMSIAQALDCGAEKFIEIPVWLKQGVQAYRGQRLSCPVGNSVRNSQ